jgi:hypothetical protein
MHLCTLLHRRPGRLTVPAHPRPHRRLAAPASAHWTPGGRAAPVAPNYRWPAGPGPLGRHGPGPKKPGTSTARHGLRRATGWPGTRVGPGLGRILGTAARH